MQKKYWKLVFLLSILGIFVAAYLSYLHFFEVKSVCDFTENISCDVVNRSSFAKIFGVPVAVLGLLAYVLIGILSLTFVTKKPKGLYKALIPRDFVLFVGAGVMFSLYLTFIELFVLKAICPFCLLSQIIIITIAYYSIKAMKLEQ